MMEEEQLHKKLFDNHKRYEENSIRNRFFKHKDILPLLAKLKAPFVNQISGYSVEERSIHKIEIGEGKTSVLLWAQMHGNEPTAAMALFDIFNFLSAKDEFDPIRQIIFQKLHLCFIPMLNPDGVERFQRRNALDIDINRDALRLQSPEGRLLKSVRDELNADWGFNLHDQPRHYSAGPNSHPAIISFLAPVFDEARSLSPKREDAIRVAGYLSDILQNYIPNCISKYTDEFYPTAFGDNMIKWGTRSILFEAGGHPYDPEKQFNRQLHFVLILSALHSIATRQFESYSLESYQQLPYNKKGRFHDLIIRNVNYKIGGKLFVLDLAFQREVKVLENEKEIPINSNLTEIGDLSTVCGYREMDGKEYEVVPGKVYHGTLKESGELSKLNGKELLLKGYTDIVCIFAITEVLQTASLLKLITQSKENILKIGSNPSLLLKKNDRVQYAIIDGKLINLSK
ncbi:MAG: peptidase M14 [Bacteroidetes bacterium]|nr:peptidase M14 [Bacteroidota bacterium]